MTQTTQDTGDQTTQVGYWQVLTTRNVAPLLLSASLSRLASEMTLFTVVLSVLVRFDSPVLAGLSGFFLTLPGFLISPVAGALLDRVGARRAVILDMLVSGVLIGLIVVASVGDWLTAPLLLGALGVFSLTSPLSAGGVRTLFPMIVPPHAYAKANALDLSTYSAIEVTGPLAAGALIALVGADPALAVVAVIFVLAALSLLAVRGPFTEPEREPRKHLVREAWDGIVYLMRNATLRGLAGAYSTYQIAFGILVVAVPVAVAQRIGGDGATEQWAGLIWSITGVCGAAGALVAGKVMNANTERITIIVTLIASAAVLPINAIASVITLGVGMALFGLVEGGLNVGVLSLRQRRTEPQWLGRVMTVSISVNLIGFPIGTALGGVLASQSVAVAFWVAAVCAAVGAVMATVLIPKAGR
ncbi:putative MFS-type transporter y4rN [Lentzea pudingi]|uniref:MFS-type transporter y4rN n=1 Tax=Lentzea pudingi TaxID=1789439 RepID=A0ABQ2INA4_9PSEU|nr:MFS transporter [Lentzea pudingi]GGN13679.1 putative MFS-type transporter y4rN [Lentzea pudingi]